MNKQLFLLLILITLFFTSTITVDAYRKRQNFDTKIHEKKRYHGKRDYANVLPCTPSDVTCVAPATTPLTCTPSGGICDLANPEVCCSQGCALQTDGTFACCQRTGDFFNCNIR
ncbi:hypothetical protein RclHR1_21450003 [Rhizophagus clarus]|uniref:WAP domain-containing protein n=1 Tax=Rhizophagus clarus TaxID=94130 RepID=A0A2Z6R6A5_9GLOM|nr:hypothetical protein RclHR1_21450003 [Rhizophagus clarus]GES77777.1 hypothetical protein GLOIN_2v1501351 [Rhizophagus clarus]